MQSSYDLTTQQFADSYASSVHDQARSQLRTVVFEWDRVSGYLGPGDRFVVTNPSHCCVGVQGVILSEHRNQTLNVLLDRPVAGRSEGHIKRADIKRIGFNREVGHNMTTQHRIMAQALNDFVLEVERELNRIADISQFDVKQSDRLDMDGEKIFVGDLVYIAPGLDIEHHYKDWLCYVRNFRPDGQLLVNAGMPPQRTSRSNIEQRCGRSGNPGFSIACQHVRLMNMSKDE